MRPFSHKLAYITGHQHKCSSIFCSRLIWSSAYSTKTTISSRSFSKSTDSKLARPLGTMDTIKNTLSENFGGKVQELSTHKFSLDDVPDLSGKVAVVTGGSEGIGYACTYTLLQHNIATVYILSVSEEAARRAQEAIAGDMGQAAADKTRWIQCDLSDWGRVRDAAEQIRRGAGRLDVLINNAGRGIMSFQLTDYGVDRHMAVNHMGHVVLTSHLLPLMRRTAAETGRPVRIANQASNLHRAAPADTRFASLDELNRDLGPNAQYGRSKLAAILYARYFARRSAEAAAATAAAEEEEEEGKAASSPDVLMNATHPGFVSTKMSKEDILEPYPWSGYAMACGLEPFKKDQFEGAASIMYAATCATASGQYICPPAVPEAGSEMARDEALGDRLMELTREVIMDKTRRDSADRGCPFDDLCLY